MSTHLSARPVPGPSTATNTVAEATDIRDIKGPVEIPGGWAWLGGALFALALAALAFLAWRRWSRRLTQHPPVGMVIPPHVRARNGLREALSLLNQPNPFCTRVSHTLRVYLEERFHLHAPERTTEEFLDELQTSALLSMCQKQSLGDFLVRCDLVKFARYEPGEPELRDLWDAALRLVDETAPPEVTPTAVSPGEPKAPEAGSDLDQFEIPNPELETPAPNAATPVSDPAPRTPDSELK